ncbi:MAG TPA: hypothetical protein VHE61_00910 [Opitutaceae bacterium]|nr:hypothetical protein [Opitutaceae bacterium]
MPSWTSTFHGKYDFGDLRGRGWYVTLGYKYLGPINWLYQSQTLYYFDDQTNWVLDGGIGYKWRTGKFRHQVYLSGSNITNRLVKVPSQNPWVTEPLRKVTSQYTLSF